MSAIFTAVVIFGLIGAAVFLIGLTKGVRETLTERRTPSRETAWSADRSYGLSALVAVVVSAVVIALAGVSPGWIYAGPFLAIVTATGVGVCFLVGNR